MKKEFFQSSLILFVGSMIGNAGAYFFHLALGRILSPAEYGTLGALLSIYLILSTPMSAIQFTAAKMISVNQDQNQRQKSYHQLNSIVHRLTIIIFLIYIIATVIIKKYFGLDSYLGLILLGVGILYIFKLSLNRGVMQGLLDFSHLSFSLAFEGIGKLLLGIIIGLSFSQADITVLSITVALFFAYLISIYYIRPRFFHKPIKQNTSNQSRSEIYHESLRMLVGMLGILFFISIDVLMAKKYLSADQAGLYTALSTLGKIVFFAPLSVAMALFPFASQEKNRQQRMILMKKALLLVVGIVSVAAVVYLVFPELIFSILFGNQYGHIGILLCLIGVAIGVVGIVQLIINYLLSQRGWSFAWALLFSSLFQFFAYYFYHQNVEQLVTMTLASAVFMLFCVSLSFLSTEKL